MPRENVVVSVEGCATGVNARRGTESPARQNIPPENVAVLTINPLLAYHYQW
jgi:hypothetical protein